MTRRKPRKRYARAPRWADDRSPTTTRTEYGEGRIARFLRGLAKPEAPPQRAPRKRSRPM